MKQALKQLIGLIVSLSACSASADQLAECKALYQKHQGILNAKFHGESALDVAAYYHSEKKPTDYLATKFAWLEEVAQNHTDKNPSFLKVKLSDSNYYGYDAVFNKQPRSAFKDLAVLAKTDPVAARAYIEADIANNFSNYKNELVSNNFANVMALWMLASDGTTFEQQLEFLLSFHTRFPAAYALSSLLARNLDDAEKMQKAFVAIASKMEPVTSQRSLWTAAAIALPKECM